MGLSLIVSRLYLPGLVRSRKLKELFRITAGAFNSQMPPLAGLTSTEILTRYAVFTREKAIQAIQNGKEFEIKKQLYEAAYRLGQQNQAAFHLKSKAEVMQFSRVVYRMIGIDFRGSPDGDIEISRCFFSRYYSARVCGIVSALDHGLLAGLSGGGDLKFSQRITEGNRCCRALFCPPGDMV